MKNSDLMEKYIKVKKAKNGIQILVCKIGWNGPSEVISKWEIGKRFQTVVPATEIEQAVAGIIEDPRFFKLCSDCGEHKPVGLIWENQICQGCAAANHGIIF